MFSSFEYGTLLEEMVIFFSCVAFMIYFISVPTCSHKFSAGFSPYLFIGT